MTPDYDVFCAYHGNVFTRLAAVLERSVGVNCPDARFVGREVRPPPKVANVRPGPVHNVAKLIHWRKWAMQSGTRPYVLMDADTLVVGDLAPVWDYDFDIAYSIRPHRCPIIGGVIFCRPVETARRYLTEWLCRAIELLLNPEECEKQMSIWGGLLQACLNSLRVNCPAGVNVMELSAEIWNCCDQVWHMFGAQTRVVHLKGRLRREALKGHMPPPGGPNADLRPIVAEYIKYLMRNY